MNFLKTFMILLILGTVTSVFVVVGFYPTHFSVVPRSVSQSSVYGSSVLDTNTSVWQTKIQDDFSLRGLSQGIGDIHQLNILTIPHQDQDLTTTLMNNANLTRAIQMMLQDREQEEPEQPPQQQQRKQCNPLKNILLLKTHKTGSSTLQNILYRFGDARGLSFALPVSDVYMGSPALFLPRFAIPSPRGYNILANHARFQKSSMVNMMPRGTKFISIVRFPPSQFESMYSYYSFNNKYHTSVEGFARDPKKYYKREERSPRHSALNPVLYDLGLSKKLLASQTEIARWIKYIDQSFDLILVAEYLYESLVLLKELMCWSWEDITFFSSNKRNNSIVKPLPAKTVKQLLEWQSGDYKLYLYFNRTLHAKIRQYGVKRMQADVEYLRTRNEALAHHCLAGTTKSKEMHGKTVINRYVLKPTKQRNHTCARMTYPASDYLDILRKKQTKLLKKRRTL